MTVYQYLQTAFRKFTLYVRCTVKRAESNSEKNITIVKSSHKSSLPYLNQESICDDSQQIYNKGSNYYRTKGKFVLGISSLYILCLKPILSAVNLA